ncbi:MAG: Kelch repeat-containing protein, partial [Pedosphaera sp.]|nr:Kelch repeat-containing protein [Pedosphaera sp.]
MLAAIGLLISWQAFAGGTWAPLLHAPPAGLNNSLVLGDGTVIAGDGGNHWYKLTPDSHGSYVNGTWTQAASTLYTRLFFSSQVLTNGNLYVDG